MLLSFAARIPAEMPLVPLYDESAPIHSSHNVRAPGGYETLRIVAYDAKQDLLLYAAVHEGFQNDPQYINAYRQYRRDPTHRQPPVPQEACYEELSVYHRGKRLAHSLTRSLVPTSSTPADACSTLIQSHRNPRWTRPPSTHPITGCSAIHWRRCAAGLCFNPLSLTLTVFLSAVITAMAPPFLSSRSLSMAWLFSQTRQFSFWRHRRPVG